MELTADKKKTFGFGQPDNELRSSRNKRQYLLNSANPGQPPQLFWHMEEGDFCALLPRLPHPADEQGEAGAVAALHGCQIQLNSAAASKELAPLLEQLRHGVEGERTSETAVP